MDSKVRKGIEAYKNLIKMAKVLADSAERLKAMGEDDLAALATEELGLTLKAIKMIEKRMKK